MRTAIVLESAAGEYMDSAEVIEWYFDIGAQVEQGQPLVSVETAKALVDVEAPVGGTLVEVTAPVGSDVDIGGILGYIDS